MVNLICGIIVGICLWMLVEEVKKMKPPSGARRGDADG